MSLDPREWKPVDLLIVFGGLFVIITVCVAILSPIWTGHWADDEGAKRHLEIILAIFGLVTLYVTYSLGRDKSDK